MKLALTASVPIVIALLAFSQPAFADDTTGVSKERIKIGVPGPFSGNASSYSKAEIGIHAYYDSINDSGGIHGRKIEVVESDTACNEAKGITAIKKLIYDDQVFLLDGVSCSGVGLAIKPIVLEAKIPWVVAHAVNQNISQPVTPYIFHAVPTSYDAAASIIDFAMSHPGSHKIAFVSHSNEWGKGYRDPEVQYLSEKYHLQPALDLAMERGSTDATPQVLQIKSSGAEFVILNLYEAETAIFLRDAAKYGLTIPSMGGYGTDLENTLKRVGSLEPVKNYFVLHAFVGTLDSPEMRKWGEMIKKYYPNEELTAFSFIGLGSAVAVVHALEAAGPDVTREKFLDAMNNIRGFKTGVLAGPLTFTPQDHQGAKQSAVAGFVDGKPTLFTSWGQRLAAASK
ncbi:MAG TPA: ABC transporter substrate-binding protein [Xanthobacteraceae bacterium]